MSAHQIDHYQFGEVFVPGAGFEPAWGCPRGIFLPLQLSLLHAWLACICGLDFTFAVPLAGRVG